MENKWEKHKRTLAELYFAQRKSLDEIMKHMAENHNFHARPSEYKQQFKLWHLPKNLKGEQWKAIDLKLKKRKRDGKQSDIYVHGIKLPRHKISKQVSQQGIFSATEMYRRAHVFDMPSWILIRTPSPSPPRSPFLEPSENPRACNGGSTHQIATKELKKTLNYRAMNCLSLSSMKGYEKYYPLFMRSFFEAGHSNYPDTTTELSLTKLDGVYSNTEVVLEIEFFNRSAIRSIDAFIRYSIDPSQMSFSFYVASSKILTAYFAEVCYLAPPNAQKLIISFNLPRKSSSLDNFSRWRISFGKTNTHLSIKHSNDGILNLIDAFERISENEVVLNPGYPSSHSSNTVTTIDEDIEMFSYIDWSLADSIEDMAVLTQD